jgi:hypothetical protein
MRADKHRAWPSRWLSRRCICKGGHLPGSLHPRTPTRCPVRDCQNAARRADTRSPAVARLRMSLSGDSWQVTPPHALTIGEREGNYCGTRLKRRGRPTVSRPRSARVRVDADRVAYCRPPRRTSRKPTQPSRRVLDRVSAVICAFGTGDRLRLIGEFRRFPVVLGVRTV